MEIHEPFKQKFNVGADYVQNNTIIDVHSGNMLLRQLCNKPHNR